MGMYEERRCLFCDGGLDATLEVHFRKITQKVNDIPENQFLSTDEDTFVRHIVSTLEIQPIELHLNGYYPGEATGETFRRSGKTDIRIENEKRTAFVAECKIWKGSAELVKAIDQLLSYLTWRDCKTALMIFNKHNAGFKKIQDQIPKILQSHTNFEKHVKCDADGEWRCILRSQEDTDRKVIVHVFLFNLYVNE